MQRLPEGAVFRRLIGQTQIGGALSPGSIAPIFKRAAQWIGMPERAVKQVVGCSGIMAMRPFTTPEDEIYHGMMIH